MNTPDRLRQAVRDTLAARAAMLAARANGDYREDRRQGDEYGAGVCRVERLSGCAYLAVFEALEYGRGPAYDLVRIVEGLTERVQAAA